ncbi:MAG: alcohol dehydrogenase catalytic domain-containing protein, partial [Planctomycetaceae bacterium]|nr:alcohol dehydrogenase catalytic domain-containing protein [Planctomycetaceae bacterium]
MCEFPRPVPVGPEVLVSVEGTTICGSDAHTVHGRRAVAVPMIAGHEIVGRILSFGPEAPLHDIGGRELNIGDRITWAIVANCGQCFFCERGLPQKCLRGIKYGHEVLSSGRELYGGLATHCLLAEGTSIIRVPEALSLAEACPASCATATVFAALEAAGPVTGRSVCIFGAGMLGLTACAAVRTLGAENVVCVDPAAERRQSAMLFGATQSVTPEEVRAVPGTMRARCAHGGERP